MVVFGKETWPHPLFDKKLSVGNACPIGGPMDFGEDKELVSIWPYILCLPAENSVENIKTEHFRDNIGKTGTRHPGKTAMWKYTPRP